MKLMGKTRDGWILYASEDEIAQLAGHSSAYYMNERSRESKLAEGSIININKLYENATATLASYKEMKEAFKKAQATIAKLLALMVPEKEEG